MLLLVLLLEDEIHLLDESVRVLDQFIGLLHVALGKGEQEFVFLGRRELLDCDEPIVFGFHRVFRRLEFGLDLLALHDLGEAERADREGDREAHEEHEKWEKAVSDDLGNVHLFLLVELPNYIMKYASLSISRKSPDFMAFCRGFLAAFL